MRNPDFVLDSLSSKSNDEKYVYKRLYRNFYNPEFYYKAYAKIAPKDGNMTAGTDGQTIDGMSKERINRIIESLKELTYKPKPSNRIYIPKKNGKQRPLGIPSIDDKLVQEIARRILESIYEGVFCETSHGFRPKRSCHTAIDKIEKNFRGVRWFVEGDIKGFFDNIDHHILIGLLRRRIKDERFIQLIWKMLKAGYLEEWKHFNSYSGTPQGGVISPVLANLFLHYTFDKWMAINHPNNPFARYADDAVIHCKTEVEAMKLLESLKNRMNECKLELHPTKTRIVYCKDDDRKENHENISFDFLGYTFRPRRSKNRWGKHFINFTPAISNKSKKSIRQKVREWKLQLKAEKELTDLSNMFNSKIKGWIN